jgi:hypothetical protein
MLSRAERTRRTVEGALRAIAVVAMATLLRRAVRPPSPDRVEVARGDVRPLLKRWTAVAPAEMRVVLDAAPDPGTRDWLRALARAGGRIRWSASRPIGTTALAAEPVPEPNGSTRIRLASAGEPVSVGDGAGIIDTLPRGGAAELEVAGVAGDVRATAATATAVTRLRDSVILRPVLVVGAAGWESKFTVAALEESGWRVASRARVAPGIEVTQGPLGTVDTTRYAAVILLDSAAAALGGEVARYVRSGGGVVLAGSAARMPAVSGIAAGGVGKRIAGVAGAVASSAPRTGLGAFPVASPRDDAVALEARGNAVVVAARRVDAGRVVQLGYDDTWRWRMAGGDEAAAAHRAWWSRIVSAVAYAPVIPRRARSQSLIDETPLASLVEALGPAATSDAGGATHRDSHWLTWFLFILAAASLLLEWTSRRLRGAR